MSKPTMTAIRNILRDRFGARQYRITRDGDIHVYGAMPNTCIIGWSLFGHVESRDTLRRLGFGE